MTGYKLGISTILSFFILTFSFSCKNEKSPAIGTLADTAIAIPASPKKLFYDSFPQPNGFVNDYEGLFTIAENDTLARMIKGFKKETTIQIAVVTFDSTMTTSEMLDATTFRIANYWSVGQKEKGNGIVIGLSGYYKKIRIEKGKGIENLLSDAEIKTMIDDYFIPSFKQGKYFEGMKTGLLSLMRQIRLKSTA